MKWKKILRSTFLVLLLIFIGLCLYTLIGFFGEKRLVGEIDDPSRYAEIRNQYPGLMRHFPETIPADATGIKFHYHPAFVQGGTAIQLKLQLPNDQVDKLAEEYSQKATLILQDGNVVKGASDGGDIPHPQLWVAADTKDLQEQYAAFFLHTEPLGEDNFLWNHGISYGAMINQGEHVVIYWAEEW